MTVAYGSALPTIMSRTVSEDETMEPGKIYHAEYKAEGISTLIPGWEDSAIARMNTAMYQQGCEPVYLGIDSQNDTITMQYRLREQAYGEATAMFVIAPVVVTAVAYIAVIAAVIIAVWLLSLVLVGGVKEINTVISDNPVMTPIIYGGVAIAGIVALIYLKNKFS
jgi:hypothetical protein